APQDHSPNLGGGARRVVPPAAPVTTTLPRLSPFAPEPPGSSPGRGANYSRPCVDSRVSLFGGVYENVANLSAAARNCAGAKCALTPHHLCGFPRTQFLQLRHRRTRHHVPRGPNVPQIVPAKVLDAGALQGVAPRPRVRLTQGSALVGE